MPFSILRPDVAAFASMIEDRMRLLDQNTAKPWQEFDREFLMDVMIRELEELDGFLDDFEAADAPDAKNAAIQNALSSASFLSAYALIQLTRITNLVYEAASTPWPFPRGDQA